MNEYDKVSDEMRILEEQAEENLDLALKSMTLLYFKASEVMNHEVCDAIDLWLCESKSKELRDYLIKQIEENNLRNDHYRRWIEMGLF